MGLFSRLFNHNTNADTNTIPEYNSTASFYKMNTLEEIEAIPVPTQKFEYNCDFTESIEYVLQRKATQYKKEGKMDLAIACLRKSNEIMPFAPMTYTSKDYERLENYLKLAGNFDEARNTHSKNTEIKLNIEDEIRSKMRDFSSTSNMIEVFRETCVCAECAKYHGRIYANSNQSTFPNIDIFMNYYSNKTCDCHLMFFPYTYGISIPRICDEQNMVSYSNRPFEDDRTLEEQKVYNEYIAKIECELKDRKDYDWLCEHLADKAPKSFGGYRNMKNKNSTNYQKLVLLAKENGYEI